MVAASRFLFAGNRAIVRPSWYLDACLTRAAIQALAPDDRAFRRSLTDEVAIDFPSASAAAECLRRSVAEPDMAEVVSKPRSCWIDAQAAMRRAWCRSRSPCGTPARVAADAAKSGTRSAASCCGDGDAVGPLWIEVRVPPGACNGDRLRFAITPRRGPRTRVDVRLAVMPRPSGREAARRLPLLALPRLGLHLPAGRPRRRRPGRGRAGDFERQQSRSGQLADGGALHRRHAAGARRDRDAVGRAAPVDRPRARRLHPRARLLALGLAVVNMVLLPFGTALGAYACWVLLKDEGRRLFTHKKGRRQSLAHATSVGGGRPPFPSASTGRSAARA